MNENISFEWKHLLTRIFFPLTFFSFIWNKKIWAKHYNKFVFNTSLWESKKHLFTTLYNIGKYTTDGGTLHYTCSYTNNENMDVVVKHELHVVD